MPADFSHPTFGEAFRFWLKLGFISFGGPTGQISIMHEELVERRKWISEERFLHALNYCMLLPGPEAQQLAIYIGWLLHRTWGGIVAGALFVLPSAFILFCLSWLYMEGQDVWWISAIFYGLKPAVLAVVVAALIRIGGKVLKNPVMWAISALSFISIFFLKLPFPLIIAAAALIGWIGGNLRADLFLVTSGESGRSSVHGCSVDLATNAEHTRPSWSRALRITATCLLLWWLPVCALGAWLGWGSTHAQQGFYFSKAALVTIGGAYAVLPYVSQQAVGHYGWLTTPQMMDGLGMAETTPGPLIMVLQFVGFAGGWQHPPAGWSPLASAALGAGITTWVTFLPCFLWILLGAPYIEKLRGNVRIACALSSITAAVVGVILNLGLWFAHHAVFPHSSVHGGKWQPDVFVIAASLMSFLLMRKWKWQMIPVIALCAVGGVIVKML